LFILLSHNTNVKDLGEVQEKDKTIKEEEKKIEKGFGES
jgi:hypothetical protein